MSRDIVEEIEDSHQTVLNYLQLGGFKKKSILFSLGAAWFNPKHLFDRINA